MDRAKLYEQLFQAKGDCLTEQQLLDYVYGNLSFEEQHHVEKHLLSCDLCDEAVEGLSLIKEENTQKIIPIIQQNINEITKKRPNYWAWAAIFSGIFVSFLAVFYFSGQFENAKYAASSISYEMETPASEAAPTMTENTIQEAEAPIIEEDPLLFQEEEKVFSPQNSPIVIAPTVESNATYSPSKVTENSKKEHQLIVNELTLDDDAQGNGIEKMEEVSDKQSIQKEYESTRNVASESKKSKSVVIPSSEKEAPFATLQQSEEMKKWAFSTIKNDNSEEFIAFSKKNYALASTLYTKKLAQNNDDVSLIFETALCYLFNQQEKEALILIKKIEKTEQGKWLSICILLQHNEVKKAKKELQELANSTTIFGKEAKNILLKLE